MVKVYLNIRSGEFSVMEKGKVVDHTKSIFLENVKFHVNTKGRERVRDLKRKEVHAYCCGDISEFTRKHKIIDIVHYNPYKNDWFTRESNNEFIYTWPGVLLQDKRIFLTETLKSDTVLINENPSENEKTYQESEVESLNNMIIPDYKEALQKVFASLLDERLETAQSSDVLESARASGAIESLLICAQLMEIMTEEETYQYLDRLDAIVQLKMDGIIEMKPFLFVPENKEGAQFILDLLDKYKDI